MPLSALFHTSSLQEQVAALGDEFAIDGEFISCETINSGHINMTFRATYRRNSGALDRYIFQRVNDAVFKRPRDVMHNVEKVTLHIHWKKLRVLKTPDCQTLNLYSARGGKKYLELPGFGFWRCYNCIERTHTLDVAESPRQAYEAACAFGTFQELLCDMNPKDIHETIPQFHHTRSRFNRLMKAASHDAFNRLDSCRNELDFIRSREKEVDTLLDLQASGSLPVRIVHNDTKINNVMLDQDTDKAVCVIDLDTVMPGSVLYDFGDMVRTMTSPAAEDEEDLDKTFMRMPMFEAVVQGYLHSARHFITPGEIALLPFSGKLITLETGIRFLTDYLEGDVYFKTKKERHNLHRARTQLKLVASMEEQMTAMQDCVRREANACGLSPACLRPDADCRVSRPMPDNFNNPVVL